MKITLQKALELLGELGYECSDLNCEALKKAAERALSADRWEALVGSMRIRRLGSAGYSPATAECPDMGYRHVGLELWTMYKHDKDFDNSLGVRALEGYADAVIKFGLITYGKQLPESD